jgi:hypothetical protein
MGSPTTPLARRRGDERVTERGKGGQRLEVRDATLSSPSQLLIRMRLEWCFIEASNSFSSCYPESEFDPLLDLTLRVVMGGDRQLYIIIYLPREAVTHETSSARFTLRSSHGGEFLVLSFPLAFLFSERTIPPIYFKIWKT